jgi:hypothetical protein
MEPNYPPTIARQLTVSSADADQNTNPSWVGRDVVIYHVTRDYHRVAMDQHDDGHVKPFSVIDQRGARVDPENYEAVAIISYKWVESVPSPFMITQNAYNSWSRDNIGNHDAFMMSLYKPLSVDDNGKEWGHASTSVGDIVHCLSTDRYYLVDGFGYTRLY